MSEKIVIKNKALKVFITGATSGIGQSLALQFADEGAILGLVGRRLELLTRIMQLMSQIKKAFKKLQNISSQDMGRPILSLPMQALALERLLVKKRICIHLSVLSKLIYLA
jgi:short-subunit dehydrogenase